MIDADGFRPNVGIILTDDQGRLLWARRVGGQDAWQFPQGGIKHNESPENALYRELEEEVGLCKADVEVLGVTQGWLRYRLPRRLVRDKEPKCVGQKQKWYLLRLVSNDSAIRLDASSPAEFDTWNWVSYWYPLGKVVAFKRDVYRRALKELSPVYNQYFLSTQGEGRALC
ncbi:RNA pyrophosphohydrolase [Saccharophagus degradans]|uniref:RNA pyrophosphohydrolase n=1 Tax=Saccharophagus degradans TaxID=86304 RepID=A0AAW7X9A3_9GAMM|nr:RNA pyrophosphohydrolase [Saccharophagus degradans]MBU2986350.1 RNA pyrophosphohydrolase [Saccharophagus degradans]MDO6423421.1 RNA pyrophosphohydrolase [Saccharophagus degradans]MDO6606826.1 RNA pyrophosphohydrolase [Saccharophagus degradans]WGO98242.1 RNA pyrophosphohydrolase [Saccharophagus degradans]